MSRIGTSRLIAFSISMLLLHPDNSASAVSRPGPAEVVMTLPVGDAGIHYNTWGESGTEYSGPTALACGPRGSFFIADAVANRVIWLRANEGPQAISLDGFTASVADIQWDGQELWVLDLLGSAVLELSTEGRIVSKTSLAIAKWS